MKIIRIIVVILATMLLLATLAGCAGYYPNAPVRAEAMGLSEAPDYFYDQDLYEDDTIYVYDSSYEDEYPEYAVIDPPYTNDEYEFYPEIEYYVVEEPYYNHMIEEPWYNSPNDFGNANVIFETYCCCGETIITRVDVEPNPFVVPAGNVFTIAQIFEENGFTLESLESVSLVRISDSMRIGVFNRLQIEEVWSIMRSLSVTSINATHEPLRGAYIFVDFQFVDPNWHVSIEPFGQVFVLGMGPFAFADGSSEQPFIDLFYSITPV